MKNRKMNRKRIDLFFNLNILKIGIIIVLWFLFVFLHNSFYALFGFEEVLFLVLAVIVLPFYFFISVLYTLKKWLEKGGLKEIVGK
jgi:hypothetical protein